MWSPVQCKALGSSAPPYLGVYRGGALSLSGPLLSHPCLTLVGRPGLSDPSPCHAIPLSSHLLFLLLLSISWAPYLLSLSIHPFIPQPCPEGWGGRSPPS